MKVGDLVEGIHTGEIFVITEVCEATDYVVINNNWLVPIEHLEVLDESR